MFKTFVKNLPNEGHIYYLEQNTVAFRAAESTGTTRSILHSTEETRVLTSNTIIGHTYRKPAFPKDGYVLIWAATGETPGKNSYYFVPENTLVTFTPN
jgi:hypothetical protein